MAAAALEEDDGAAVPEGDDADVFAVVEVLADDQVAWKPVLLLQLGPAVSLAPETNLTGAHYTEKVNTILICSGRSILPDRECHRQSCQ